MNWPKNLTTFEGSSPGKGVVRSLEAKVGGMDGIRRVEVRDPDGTVHVLNTRNGFPEVVSTKPLRRGATDYPSASRGWLARISPLATAAQFSPYSLHVSAPNFSPAKTCYSVLPFTTSYNVVQPDAVHWGDVISFSASGLRINGKPMPSLGIAGIIQSSGSLPWLIPAVSVGGGVALYGDASLNSYVKRVFAVGRYSVHSWAGADAVMNGALYRSQKKAHICGPRIETATHKAWLSQLVYTGPTWDDIDSGWAFTTAEVAMLLTPPFLEKVDGSVVVDQPSCVPQSIVAESGTTSSAYTLPPTAVCAVGIGELGAAQYGDSYFDQFVYVVFPIRDVFKAPVQGNLITSALDTRKANEVAVSTSIDGYEVVSLTWCSLTQSALTESYSVFEQNVPIGTDIGTLNVDDYGTYYEVAGVAEWPGAGLVPRFDTGAPGAFLMLGGAVPGSASYAVKKSEGGASVRVGDRYLMAVNFARRSEQGDRCVPDEVTGRYAGPLSNPYGWIDSTGGFGVIQKTRVVLHSGSPLDCIGLREPLILARAAKAVGGAAFNAWGNEPVSNFYTSHAERRPTLDDHTLNWETRDFILFDEENQVFISVDGTFSGTQHYGTPGEATLHVTLSVSTPSGSSDQVIFQSVLGYVDMLQEQVLQSGITYVPAPRVRTMFTPLHKGQGDFKGAAYTTASEVSNGAVPAYLFNFVLSLGTYGDIGADDEGTGVRFIPCNLIEMLYAYVFSTKFGVDEYQRYPIDFTIRHKAFMETLFSNQWRVSWRDGAFVDWLDTLGGAYVTEQTTELYRI